MINKKKPLMRIKKAGQISTLQQVIRKKVRQTMMMRNNLICFVKLIKLKVSTPIYLCDTV